MVKIFNGTQLKLIAMGLMLVDHIGLIFFPGIDIFRIIGRLAFPIFAYFIVEGFIHTRDIRKYMLRMGIFAVISEPAFDFAISGEFINNSHQNVMFTFLLGLIMLWGISKENPFIKICAITGPMICALLLVTDYDMYGMILILIIYCFYDSKIYMVLWTSVAHMLLSTGIQRWAILSNVLLLFYNGKRGPNIKWLFYGFYPAHLLVLGLLAYC